MLIPRPETEELVHWIIQDCAKHADPVNIIDIGTGSGCIAIALKRNLPTSVITGLDFSKEALATATTNAIQHDAAISLVEADFLVADNWKALARYDVIVSNPPYIPESEQLAMHDNVLLHEPHLALFVPNHSPLLFYEELVQFAKNHLAANGSVYVEIHKAHAQETKALFETAFATVELKQDMSGNDRMIKATHFRKQ